MDVEIIDSGSPTYDGIGETVEDWQIVTAIGVIMMGGSNRQASEQSGIAERTLYRLKKLERWKERERDLHADMVGNARSAIIGLLPTARQAIADVFENPDMKGSPTKLAAALAVLDRASHILPDIGDKEIRRIISRVPRSVAQPHTPSMPTEEEQETATPTTDAPEQYGIPASSETSRVRQSVRLRRIEERKIRTDTP